MADEKIDLSGDIDIAESPQSYSFKQRMMALSLSNISVRDWVQKRRDGVQPWAEFLQTSKFRVPKSIAPIGGRIVKNIDKFQSNYLFIFLGLCLFCVLTSPLLLVAIAVCLGACYIISLRNAENKLVIMGKEISLAQQYAGVGIMSFPLFWLAGAGSVVFWIIGASFFVVMLHASMYTLDDEAQPFVDDLDSVETV